MSSAKRPQALHWILTENNPEGQLDVLFQELYDDGEIEYACWQLEVGDNAEQAEQHHQIFVTFTKKTRLTAIQKILPGIHAEICRDPAASRDYCRKEESRLDGPWEVGKYVEKTNNAKVWAKIRDEVKQGLNLKDLCEKFPAQVFMYHKGISTVATLYQAKRDAKTKVEVWVGPPGSGKSRGARDRHPSAYWKQPDSIWFDGYAGEDCVVFDDFYGSLPWSTLLQVMDRYPMMVQQKGTTANFAPKTAIFTSNKLPYIWYKNLFNTGKVDPRALFRRIDELHLWNELLEKYEVHPDPENYLWNSWNSFKNSRENLPELYEKNT